MAFGKRGIRTHALAFVFHARALGEPLGPRDSDGWVQEARWVPVAELEWYLEPARRLGWRGFYEPLLDCVEERVSGARFYGYIEERSAG